MPRSSKSTAPQKLMLRKFDITSMPDDSVVVFIGKRCTGKSILVKDLLYHKQDIPVATVVSATEGANKFYSEIVPKPFIHKEYDEGIVERVLERQKRVVKDIQRETRETGDSDIDARAALLLDDCMYDSKWTRSKHIRSVFMNGRHYKLLFLLTMQYCLGIPPNLRTNVDYVFILRESIYANRKRLYDAFAGMFRTFDQFSRVMDACTEDYHCLVLHNNAKSNRVEDQVFWYKASMHKGFRFGHPSFWAYDDGVETDEDDDFKDVGQNSTDGLTVLKGDYDGTRWRRS